VLRRLTQPEGAFDPLGFRLRGLEMTRLETFVDAAFAFSVTMLALSPDRVPTSFDQMSELLKGVPAFGVSLALLLLFWNGHVVFSRRFGLDDSATTLLSCVFIGVMLVYVYPLKFMISVCLAHYIPPLRTPSFYSSVSGPSDLAVMFVVMSSGFVLMHALFVLLYRQGLRRAAELELTAHEVRIARCEIGLSLIYMGVGGLSVALATLFRHGAWVVSAGFVYILLGVLGSIYWAIHGPSKDAIRAARG
jgi:hypothetical protein